MKRKWDVADATTQKICVDEVITRIEEIGDSRVGIIAAQEVIDIVMDKLAPEIYNMGVRDARKKIEEKLADVQVDLDLLEQAS